MLWKSPWNNGYGKEDTLAKQLYFRYVKTSSLNKILKPLHYKNVLSLEARRSREENKTPFDSPLWINTSTSERTAFEVDFNSILYGLFSKSDLRDAMNACGLEDAVVNSLDIHLRKMSVPIGEELAEMLNDPSMKGIPYIAHFEKHPCAQDGEENPYTKQVRRFMSQEIRKYGFKPASLDFDYVLPLNNWKELTRTKKTSKKYKDMMDNWRERMKEIDNPTVRKVALEIFPQGMQSGRIYRLGKTDQWRIRKVGDI